MINLAKFDILKSKKTLDGVRHRTVPCLTTLASGAINAALNVGTYAINTCRKNEEITTQGMFFSAAIGFASGCVGNIFRYQSTSALRETGEKLLEKGATKISNGIANSATSTIKRGFNYIDRGIDAIYQYAYKAGVNSGFGSTVGCLLGTFQI